MVKLRYIFEAVIAYVMYFIFWLLPAKMASDIGGFLGRNIGIKLGASRKAFSNIKLAMPDKSDDEIHQIIKNMWDNLGRVITEYPHLKKIAGNVEIINKNILDEIVNSDKPAIMLSGHFANWEVMTAAAKLQFDMDIAISYRKLNNPYVDKLLCFARRFGAVEYIHKSRKSAKEMMLLIKRGGILGLLTDQKYNEGIPIPFFGNDAMTMPVAAQFALSLDCPVYPIRVERIGKYNFRITAFPKIEIDNTGNKKADVYKIMLGIHSIFEDWIKDKPEQWLWLHRRWY